MQITDELLDHLARLSKLSFQEDEKQAVKGEIQRMLEFVDKLQELDTSGVEPLIHMTEEVNQVRDDKPVLQLTPEEVLKNAPKQDGNFFRVPKVVKK